MAAKLENMFPSFLCSWVGHVSKFEANDNVRRNDLCDFLVKSLKTEIVYPLISHLLSHGAMD